MARAVTLGNGNILVGIDHLGLVRDFYFPYVGLSNHISGASGSYVHRIGIFVDGKISWIDDGSWKISVTYDAGSVVGNMHAVNDALGLTLTSTDVVHNEANLFIRNFVLTNEKNEVREAKVFFAQQFRISESRRGDTGFYDPRVKALIHYKGNVKFLVNAYTNETPFSEFSIGLFGIEGKDGTYHDAEDGVLEGNPIEHGSVDSVIGVTCSLQPNAHAEIFYWIAAGETINAVHDLNQHLLEETPEVLISSTRNYWKAWLGTKDPLFKELLSKKLQDLYNRSLTIIRVHADNGGGIIASSDTDMLHHGRDTYSYVWPRDASIIAHALDRAGHHSVARSYFKFMSERLDRGGFLMHKYRTDGALGSSWHPWIQNGVSELPIQEDETALTLYMLWRHFELAEDIEFIESLYNPFIEPVADFLCEYVESAYGLPQSSYDLWEEKYGISTYTASAVYGALLAAVQFANTLGKQEAARTYSAVAQRMRQAILDHLFRPELGMFAKLARVNSDGDLEFDNTLDVSSFFGPIYFGVVDLDDDRVKKAFKTTQTHLEVKQGSEGYIRYVGDSYYTMQDADSPNPWVITTLWMAQYQIMKARNLKDLEAPFKVLEWTCGHATKSGVLSEQMHPRTRAHLSTSPLVWSHAEFVLTVEEYLDAYRKLSRDD